MTLIYLAITIGVFLYYLTTWSQWRGRPFINPVLELIAAIVSCLISAIIWPVAAVLMFAGAVIGIVA